MSADVEGTASEVTWETEEYVLVPDEGTADIGQVIFDTGLIYLINQTVLHSHGFAIGVTVDEGKVKGLNLHRTDDPEGLWFDEETTELARRKLIESGITLSPQKRGCKAT